MTFWKLLFHTWLFSFKLTLCANQLSIIATRIMDLIDKWINKKVWDTITLQSLLFLWRWGKTVNNCICKVAQTYFGVLPKYEYVFVGFSGVIYFIYFINCTNFWSFSYNCFIYFKFLKKSEFNLSGVTIGIVCKTQILSIVISLLYLLILSLTLKQIIF